MPAVDVETASRRCRLEPDEVERLAGELRRLPHVDGAGSAAIIFEAALADEAPVPIKLEPLEEAATLHVLSGIEVKQGRVGGGLQCLFDGLRIDAGLI